jgi:hypothetical protein
VMKFTVVKGTSALFGCMGSLQVLGFKRYIFALELDPLYHLLL